MEMIFVIPQLRLQILANQECLQKMNVPEVVLHTIFVIQELQVPIYLNKRLKGKLIKMKSLLIKICFAITVICNAQNNNLGIINGTVEGYPKFDVNLLLNTLEKIKPETESKLNKIFNDFNKKYGQKVPLAGSVVILQGENIRRKTYADNNGNFTFNNLPYGKYLVTTSVADCTGVYPNTKMTATESKFIAVNDRNPQHFIFTPDIFHVDLYGKVVNQSKQPVAGAKVTATWIYPQTFLEQGNIPTWETVTDENGNFELKGIPPSNWLLIAGALLSKQRSYDGIEIKIITAEGVKSTPIKLSLISEDNLYLCGCPRKLDNLTWCKMPVK